MFAFLHVSHVPCHVSCVTCPKSHVKHHIYIYIYIFFNGLNPGTAISGGLQGSLLPCANTFIDNLLLDGSQFKIKVFKNMTVLPRWLQPFTQKLHPIAFTTNAKPNLYIPVTFEQMKQFENYLG